MAVATDKISFVLEYLVDTPNATLLFGRGSRFALEQLYQIVRQTHNSGYITERLDETKFWLELLKAIPSGHLSYRPDLERDTAVAFVETALRKANSFHLFLPDVDKAFYQFDVMQKGLMGNSLRRIWQNRDNNLTILASVENPDSPECSLTFANYHYQFYINCWAPVYLDGNT